MDFKARFRTNSNTEYQLLTTHLEETALIAEQLAEKINLSRPAILIALVHDIGKNCEAWQKYLDYSNQNGSRNEKEDHATAGGQYLYRGITQNSDAARELIGQLLAACVMYHHGPGLPDVIKPDGTPILFNRLEKKEEDVHTHEAVAGLDLRIRQRIEAILNEKDFISSTISTLEKLTAANIKQARFFNLGLTARFLSSCLIDADRRSSAYFDRGISVTKDEDAPKVDWALLRKRLENRLSEFPAEGKLNEIRRLVSCRCAEFAKRKDDIYTLTAATGAGKTLASLRYALVHADYTGKDHIFVIAPYTSILDQNADIIRGILDPNGENGRVVLEHHSALDQSEKTEHFSDSIETWDTPIIITTMVRFLESIFSFGTRKIRRMHQLANSIIIFDEVQTLPAGCSYLFNWAIRYLCQNANVAVLLSTATQPGLDKFKKEYALSLPDDNEIIPDKARHFEDLKRVELFDATCGKGWTLDEVADFIASLKMKSILTVVNTKAQAEKLYENLLKNNPDWYIVHLSANMCPAHRKKAISQLKELLKSKIEKCVCISTRLIEAGVDIDFDGAIRFLAGFDSIIQTAGRCNRNGELKDTDGNPVNGKVWIINNVKDEERIDSLPELIQGQKNMKRILNQFHENEGKYNNTLMHLDLIADYFKYYYGEMPDSLLKYKIPNRDDTILDLLSDNAKSNEEYNLTSGESNTRIPLTKFRQSFESAWEEFKVISQNTIGVIVPYEKGVDIIATLFGKPDIRHCVGLLREAQQYSVNVYFSDINYMLDKRIIRKIPLDGMDIYAAEEKHYNQNLGLTHEEGKMKLCNV